MKGKDEMLPNIMFTPHFHRTIIIKAIQNTKREVPSSLKAIEACQFGAIEIDFNENLMKL